MCLAIDKSVKIPKANQEGLCLGYKAVSPNHISYYWGHEYHVGINHSGRKSIKLETDEHCLNQVYKGFHIFLSLKSARQYKYELHQAIKIIRVYFRKEDVVATGVWEGRGGYKCLVVKKLRVKSLIGIK